MSFEKKINKRLIGLVIGGALIGGLSATPKGRKFWQKVKDFFKDGCKELSKEMKKKKSDS